MADTKDATIRVKVTDSLHDEAKAIAESEGHTLSSWTRHLLTLEVAARSRKGRK